MFEKTHFLAFGDHCNGGQALGNKLQLLLPTVPHQPWRSTVSKHFPLYICLSWTFSIFPASFDFSVVIKPVSTVSWMLELDIWLNKAVFVVKITFVQRSDKELLGQGVQRLRQRCSHCLLQESAACGQEEAGEDQGGMVEEERANQKLENFQSLCQPRLKHFSLKLFPKWRRWKLKETKSWKRFPKWTKNFSS